MGERASEAWGERGPGLGQGPGGGGDERLAEVARAGGRVLGLLGDVLVRGRAGRGGLECPAAGVHGWERRRKYRG